MKLILNIGSLLLLIALLASNVHVQAQGSKFPVKSNIKTKADFEAVDDVFTFRTPKKAQIYNILMNDSGVFKYKITSFTITKQPKGTMEVLSERVAKISYLGDYEGNEPDSFEYEICAAAGKCDRATVTIHKCPRLNPILPEITLQTLEKNETIEFDYPDYIIALSVAPKHGTATFDTDSTHLTYTPNKDFTGIDKFRFEVYQDNGPVCGHVYIEGKEMVLPILPNQEDNESPVAVTDEVSVKGRAKLKIAVLDNDYDPEGTLVKKITKVSLPKNGKIKRSSKVIVYTANSRFYGTDKFTYEVCDYNGACTTGEVIVKVKK